VPQSRQKTKLAGGTEDKQRVSITRDYPPATLLYRCDYGHVDDDIDVQEKRDFLLAEAPRAENRL
jgi:hypothetical protein